MGAQGTAVLDFGAWPGSDIASVAVTGQTGILAGSEIEAWLMTTGTGTTDHSSDEHLAEEFIEITAKDIVAGTGFTIYGKSKWADGGEPVTNQISGYATSATGASWTNPNNALGNDDGNYATCTSANSGATLDLDFSALTIPTGAVVTGIGFFVTRFGVGGGTAFDNTVQVRKNGTVQTAVNHGRSSQYSNSAAEAIKYGGAGDLWGTTWTGGDTVGLRLASTVSISSAGIDSVFGFAQYTRAAVGHYGQWNVGWVWA